MLSHSISSLSHPTLVRHAPPFFLLLLLLLRCLLLPYLGRTEHCSASRCVSYDKRGSARAGAEVVTKLVDDMAMSLWNNTNQVYEDVPFVDGRTVLYPDEMTGNVHVDRPGTANTLRLFNKNDLQMLVKLGHGRVGFVMSSRVLKENLCVWADKMLVIVVSVWLLEHLAHTAAASVRSMTYVANMHVPTRLLDSIPRFMTEVLQHPVVKVTSTELDDGFSLELDDELGLTQYERERGQRKGFITSYMRDMIGVGACASTAGRPTPGVQRPRHSTSKEVVVLRKSPRLNLLELQQPCTKTANIGSMRTHPSRARVDESAQSAPGGCAPGGRMYTQYSRTADFIEIQ